MHSRQSILLLSSLWNSRQCHWKKRQDPNFRFNNCAFCFLFQCSLHRLHWQLLSFELHWLGCQNHHCWRLFHRIWYFKRNLWKMVKYLLWRKKPYEWKCLIQTFCSKLPWRCYQRQNSRPRLRWWRWRESKKKDDCSNHLCLWE
jgi:hypothetical protein